MAVNLKDPKVQAGIAWGAVYLRENPKAKRAEMLAAKPEDVKFWSALIPHAKAAVEGRTLAPALSTEPLPVRQARMEDMMTTLLDRVRACEQMLGIEGE